MNLFTFLFSFRGDSTAMFIDAIERGDIPAASYALEDGRVFSGANIDIIDAKSVQNALTSSLIRKDFDTAKFLVENKATINLSLEDVLDNAIKTDDLDGLKFLIQNGADVDYVKSVQNALLTSSLIKKDFDMAKFLVENKADVNLSLEKVIYNTIKTDDLDGLKFLIQNGADVNSITGPNTALMIATIEGSLELVKFLVDSGADINAKNQAGTVLYMAKDNIDIAKFLIEEGAEITNKDRVELEKSGVIPPKTQPVEELEAKAEEATGEYYPPYDYYSHIDISGNNEALVDGVRYYDEE